MWQVFFPSQTLHVFFFLSQNLQIFGLALRKKAQYVVVMARNFSRARRCCYYYCWNGKLGYLINGKMKSSMSLSKLYVLFLACDIFSLVSDVFLSSLLNPLEGPSVLSCENVELKGVLDFQDQRGVEGHARSPGIRLGRGTRLSSLNLHPKPTTKGLVHIREHPWVLGQAMGTLTHKTHHGPDSGEATTFPHIVFSATLRGGYIQMALFPGTLKLESRNCPETILIGVPRLWQLISPDFQV